MSSSTDGKIFISWLKLGIFIGLFIALGTTVGLLARFVNHSCEKVSKADNELIRIKREEPVYHAYMDSLPDNNDKASRFKFLQSLLKNKPRDDLPTCTDIGTSQDGSLPWESLRLPNTVIPSEYTLEILEPIFATETFSGGVTITVDVQRPTNLIIMHSRMLSEYLPTIVDVDNNNITLACHGYYLPNDYYIIRTQNALTTGRYYINVWFTGYINTFDSGIFQVKYKDNANEFDGNLLTSHFEPIDARTGFPCFDEPQLKARFNLIIDHLENTTALSNTPRLADDPDIIGEPGYVQTSFATTPKLPTYLVSFTVFNSLDFSSVSTNVSVFNGVQLSLYARKNLIDGGFADEPLEIFSNIITSLATRFFPEVSSAIPSKIDIFAMPMYPTDGVPHYGLAMFKENIVLFKNVTMTEWTKQTTVLLMAKQMCELYFGNLVTFRWWNELWLQEGLSDFMKYKVVDDIYPDWRVYEQFITEELIDVLVDDGYPSSHPVIKKIDTPNQIVEHFDSVERGKTVAILRMVEDDAGAYEFLHIIKDYLLQFENSVGVPDYFFIKVGMVNTWDAKEFVNRWFLQPNYPQVTAKIVQNSDQLWYLNLRQDRFLNSDFSFFANLTLYPSPYNYTWYIPLKCKFGRTPDEAEPLLQSFYMNAREHTILIGDGFTQYAWVHCDAEFTGYYIMDYTVDNWKNLGLALKAFTPGPERNYNLDQADRASIIHNLFVGAHSMLISYHTLVDVLSYLKDEADYLPWRTAYKHVHDLASIMEYRRSFYPVAKFFNNMMRDIESNMDVWQASDDHVEELTKEIILDMACKLQDKECLTNASSYWPAIHEEITNDTPNTTIATRVKSLALNYHFQNTYDFQDWNVLFSKFDINPDFQLQHQYMESLTYTRLPWLLATFLERENANGINYLNFFEVIRLLSKNPLGREITWDYIRDKYRDISEQYDVNNPAIGQMIIDVTKNFENEFLLYELLDFLLSIQGTANQNAILKAAEIVSTNVIWIFQKENEIQEAFSQYGSATTKTINKENNLLLAKKGIQRVQEKLTEFKKQMSKKM